jgi:hypothetical protein
MFSLGLGNRQPASVDNYAIYRERCGQATKEQQNRRRRGGFIDGFALGSHVSGWSRRLTKVVQYRAVSWRNLNLLQSAGAH